MSRYQYAASTLDSRYQYAASTLDFAEFDLSSPFEIRRVEELTGLPKPVQTLVMIKSQAIVREFNVAMEALNRFDPTPVPHPPDAAYADYVAACEAVTAFRRQWVTADQWDSGVVPPREQDSLYDVTELTAWRDATKVAREALRQHRRDRFADLIALAIALRDAQITTMLLQHVGPTAKAAFDAI